jgi:hypothetical protein
MPLQAHKYNNRAPHCCKQRTTTLAQIYRDLEPATLNITCCYTNTRQHSDLRSESSPPATFTMKTGIRRHKLEAKMLTKNISTWWWSWCYWWCCQHKMARGRRSRSTTTLQFAPIVSSHAWEGEGDNVRSEVVSVKRGRGRRPRVLCSASTQFTQVWGAGISFSSTHRFPVFEQIEIQRTAGFGDWKVAESKTRRVRVSQPL